MESLYIGIGVTVAAASGIGMGLDLSKNIKDDGDILMLFPTFGLGFFWGTIAGIPVGATWPLSLPVLYWKLKKD